jgi:hypothetical protein
MNSKGGGQERGILQVIAHDNPLELAEKTCREGIVRWNALQPGRQVGSNGVKTFLLFSGEECEPSAP